MPSTWSVTAFVDWLQGKPPGASGEDSARTDRRRRARPRPRSIPWRPVDGEDPGELFETGWPDEVFVLQSVFRDIRGHLPENPGDQRYGFLLGRRLECPATCDPYLLIDEIWAAPDPLRERGGTQGFEVELEEARRRATRGEKDVLGWYHTHSPLMGLQLSEHDVRLHSRFFPERWHCALVEVAHGETPVGGLFQRRLKHRYPGTKLISFLEVSEANGGPRWGEMESQLDWTNYETPRNSVRRAAPPREPGPVIRARGRAGPGEASSGRAAPKDAGGEAPLRRRPVEGPSWKWLPPRPSDGDGRGSSVAAPPAARSGPAAPSSPRRTNGKTQAPDGTPRTADGRGAGGPAVYPAPPSSLPPALPDPAEATEPRPKKQRAAPEPAGEWVASPLPSRGRTASERAGVVPDEAEAEPAGEVASDEGETHAEEAAAEAVVQTAEEAPADDAAEEAPAAEAAVEVADEPPAEMGEATTEDAAAAEAATEAAAPAPRPVAPIPPDPVEESVAPPEDRSWEWLPLELEPAEPSRVRPEVVPAASRESYPFRLEPAEESTPNGSLERAVDALRAVLGARRRGDPEEPSSDTATAVAARTPEASEPERSRPSRSGQAAAGISTPAPATAGGGFADEVPVVLPARETWSERMLLLRMGLRRHWKTLVAVPLLLIAGFLAFQALGAPNGSRSARFDSGGAAAAAPRSAEVDSRLDALQASLSLFQEQHASFEPGETGCIALGIAMGSVDRDHESLVRLVERQEELPDDAASRWRSLSARVDAAHEDFQEAGCETES